VVVGGGGAEEGR
jgi:hypothetical protein